MRRHGTFGGETAENAHAINEIANKWNGDNFVDRLGQVVEGQGQIGKDIGVLGHEGESTRRSRQETSILAEVEKSHGGGGSTKSLEAITKSIPLLQ